jgi:hypothetical protein
MGTFLRAANSTSVRASATPQPDAGDADRPRHLLGAEPVHRTDPAGLGPGVMAGGWRLAGVECRPLFRAPLAAPSLRAFWGRRWNLAFAEMTALIVYRPVARRLGTGLATAAAFLFSGLLHELAISAPVRAGYGLPLLYFALHGLLALAEQRLEQHGMAVERWGWLGHVWTLGGLALPLPILFHPYFLRGVVWPLIGLDSP